MNKEILNKLLNEEHFKLDFFDKLNGITLEDKKTWKESEIIEENAKCPNCKKQSLVETGPDQIFLCSSCGEIFDITTILL